MRIAICDDETIIQKQLNSIVEIILTAKGLSYEIQLYDSGVQLLQSQNTYDIILLDIEMPELDGIETGKRIHEKNPNSKIVIVTSIIERFKDAFKIEAFRFVTKPLDTAEIEEAIDSYIIQQIGTETIEVYNHRIKCNFTQKSLIYARAYNGYVELLIQNKIFRREESLNHFEMQLDKRCFVRINKEYCINLFYVTDYKSGTISIGGKDILVSRRKKKNFEKELLEFGINYR